MSHTITGECVYRAVLTVGQQQPLAQPWTNEIVDKRLFQVLATAQYGFHEFGPGQSNVRLTADPQAKDTTVCFRSARNDFEGFWEINDIWSYSPIRL
jgi:hypothetical protein